MEQEKLNELLKSYYFYKENKEAVEAFCQNDAFTEGEYQWNAYRSFKENIERYENYFNADVNMYFLHKQISMLSIYILEKILYDSEEMEGILDQQDVSIKEIDYVYGNDPDYSFWEEITFTKGKEDISLFFDIDNLRLVANREYAEKINNDNLWEPINENKRKNYSDMATASIDKILNKGITIDELVNRLKDPAKQFLEKFIEICDAKSKENEESENDEDSED